MAPPQGLLIGPTSKPWAIGPLLGSGACGSVHSLLPPSNSSTSSQSYAIKLATLPKTKATGKRKKTAEERNADLILHEYQTLQNLGREVRGVLVPDIPFVGPPPYGVVDGESLGGWIHAFASPFSPLP